MKCDCSVRSFVLAIEAMPHWLRPRREGVCASHTVFVALSAEVVRRCWGMNGTPRGGMNAGDGPSVGLAWYDELGGERLVPPEMARLGSTEDAHALWDARYSRRAGRARAPA